MTQRKDLGELLAAVQAGTDVAAVVGEGPTFVDVDADALAGAVEALAEAMAPGTLSALDAEIDDDDEEG